MTVEKMNLQPVAANAARAIQAVYNVEFTSGRRGLTGQAHAMALNIYRNRLWVQETYTRKDRPSYAVAQKVQDALLKNPDAKSPMAIARVILGVLESDPNGALISFHPAGLAFDFKPVEPEDGPVTDAIRQLLRRQPGFDAFVTEEGGFRIYHAQFLPITVEV